MWPWGHLAAGYLVYAACSRVRAGRPPDDGTTLALAVGTQLADLIDKPLAWTLGVLPNGRSLGHSAVLALPVAAVGWYLLPDRYKPYAGALGIGHATHLLTDAIHPVVTGDLYYAGFLGWPVVPPVEYPTQPSFLAHLTSVEFTPWFSLQIGLVVVATVVWYVDAMPGVGMVKPD